MFLTLKKSRQFLSASEKYIFVMFETWSMTKESNLHCCTDSAIVLLIFNIWFISFNNYITTNFKNFSETPRFGEYSICQDCKYPYRFLDYFTMNMTSLLKHLDLYTPMPADETMKPYSWPWSNPSHYPMMKQGLSYLQKHQ